MKKTCPGCYYINPDEASFCMKCGSQLKVEEHLTQHLFTEDELPTKDIDITIGDEEAEPPPPPPAIPIFGAKVSLYLLDARRTIPVMGINEFTVGRKMPGADVAPDIDLTPYNAFSLGVSRLHAAIKVTDDDVFITDLGSSNGTAINNIRITGNEAYIIKHKDIATMGLFRIQFLIRLH